MLGINFQQILLHVFNFVLLLLVLNELLYKPIVKFMDDREAYYKSLDKETNENLEKSKGLLKQRELELKDIHIEANRIKEKAIKESQVQAKQEINQAKEEGKKIIEKARSQSKLEKDILIRNTKKDLREVAIEAAAKLSLLNNDVYDDFLKHVNEDDNE
ncbi:ATP synthase F0 subunit B [Helcococcus sueciensis]|uniref:ATP synthase F0 subunit B n=1 Tax=Helcococcus sueciensis TaxID=241555 RepID=UPI00041FB17F|nr:ATP synthase F0 subunit B [Helcococcus sueciensis]